MSLDTYTSQFIVNTHSTIYKANESDSESAFTLPIHEKIKEARNVALVQLGRVPKAPEESFDFPFGVKKISSDDNTRGFYIYVKKNEETQEGFGTPFQWIAGLMSGLVLPILSFCIGRDFGKNLTAEKKLDKLRQFQAYELPRNMEARNGSADYYRIQKAVTSCRAIMENNVANNGMKMVAKIIMAVGFIFAALAVKKVGLLAGLAFGSPLLVLGTCLFWSAWGYQSGLKPQMNQEAETILEETSKLQHAVAPKRAVLPDPIPTPVLPPRPVETRPLEMRGTYHMTFHP